MKTLTGVIHGNTIQLNESPDLAEGETVEISLRIILRQHAWGDGLRRCAGALAAEWSADDDRILDQIQQERQAATHRDLPE